MRHPNTITDVAIIGAGPTGLFAAFECGMLRLSCQIIDALDTIGGQCAALYPEKPIYDIPGFPQVQAETLIANLAAQAAPFQPIYHLGQQVMALQRDATDTCWHLTTDKGLVVPARTVIIAAGVGAFGPNRPPLEGLAAFEGHSVFYAVTNRAAFQGKRVVIAGGGDSAIDWALALVESAERVTVVHRRARFRAAPANEARLKALAEQGALDLAIPYQLDAIEGANGQCTRIILRDLNDQTRAIDADVLLPFYGLSSQLGPILEWGLQLDKSHIMIDPGTARTSIPSIYAIGDIATYPHKLKLILTGFAEAAHAAHAIRKQLFPDEVVHFEYSTTKGVPGSTAQHATNPQQLRPI